MKEIIDDPENSKLFMILEYCEKGEVKWKIDGPALTVSETRRIFRETLLGLEYRESVPLRLISVLTAVHHQGIIHRDIKPSNLLLASDGSVKISDFGCSHYSEALREAAHDGDDYVNDIELAKTAGSPAFFAPEMCYSGDDTLDMSGLSIRSRLPITNAIDVWALGVTLYCLLFGTTPFDAVNEYLLMQVIPTAEVVLPSTMGADELPATDSEAAECIDLLLKLLTKDPSKRISLEQAKVGRPATPLTPETPFHTPRLAQLCQLAGQHRPSHSNLRYRLQRRSRSGRHQTTATGEV